MQCRNSPLAKSPPPNLPKIPGVTSPSTETKENGHTPGELNKVPGKWSSSHHVYTEIFSSTVGRLCHTRGIVLRPSVVIRRVLSVSTRNN